MCIYVLIYVRYCIIYVTHEHVLLNVNKVFSIKLSSSCLRRYGAYEPRHETNGCLHMRNKDADQFRGDREADQRLCLRYTESTIPLLP